MYHKIVLALIVFFLMPLSNLSPALAAGNAVIALAYHDVIEKPYNAFAITPTTFKEQLAFLKANGYHPISVEQYINACKKDVPLPDKPVLLTFDDGYQSFYTTVFPLLQQYQYPALLAIVTSWPDYAPPDVGTLLTWQQIREIDQSGLVTIASHSDQSHRSVSSTPQGDQGNMLETRQYESGEYESFDLYQQRIQSDFQESQRVFKQELGHPVTAMVWPYGAYTTFAVDMAQKEGFEVFFGLSGGFNFPTELSLRETRRGIMETNLTGTAFATFLKSGGHKSPKLNAAQLDIDLLYNQANPEETEHNLTIAIEKFKATGINTVFLQAFSDSSGSGNIESVYFYTTHAPIKATIFNHISTRLRAEGFAVYAWMPTLACQWLLGDPEDRVTAYTEQGKGWYTRATPFSPLVTKNLQALFSDLAAYNYMDGILFQDDLYLTDYEDFSSAGKTAFKETTGRTLTPENLKDQTVRAQWTQLKTNTLTQLTQELITTMQQYRPYLASARNLYPSLITEPPSEEWLAQNYYQYLATYDYTIIMAYPSLENQATMPLPWLEQLAGTALKDKVNASKTIFKLQTYDWNKKIWLSTKEFNQQVITLKNKGVLHFAYYPDNIFLE